MAAIAKPTRHKELRKAIRISDLTQADVASQMGCTRETLCHKLSGKIPIRMDEAYRILDILHLDPHSISIYFPAEDQCDMDPRTRRRGA